MLSSFSSLHRFFCAVGSSDPPNESPRFPDLRTEKSKPTTKETKLPLKRKQAYLLKHRKRGPVNNSKGIQPPMQLFSEKNKQILSLQTFSVDTGRMSTSYKLSRLPATERLTQYTGNSRYQSPMTSDEYSRQIYLYSSLNFNNSERISQNTSKRVANSRKQHRKSKVVNSNVYIIHKQQINKKKPKVAESQTYERQNRLKNMKPPKFSAKYELSQIQEKQNNHYNKSRSYKHHNSALAQQQLNRNKTVSCQNQNCSIFKISEKKTPKIDPIMLQMFESPVRKSDTITAIDKGDLTVTKLENAERNHYRNNVDAGIFRYQGRLNRKCKEDRGIVQSPKFPAVQVNEYASNVPDSMPLNQKTCCSSKNFADKTQKSQRSLNAPGGTYKGVTQFLPYREPASFTDSLPPEPDKYTSMTSEQYTDDVERIGYQRSFMAPCFAFTFSNDTDYEHQEQPDTPLQLNLNKDAQPELSTNKSLYNRLKKTSIRNQEEIPISQSTEINDVLDSFVVTNSYSFSGLGVDEFSNPILSKTDDDLYKNLTATATTTNAAATTTDGTIEISDYTSPLSTDRQQKQQVVLMDTGDSFDVMEPKEFVIEALQLSSPQGCFTSRSKTVEKNEKVVYKNCNNSESEGSSSSDVIDSFSEISKKDQKQLARNRSNALDSKISIGEVIVEGEESDFNKNNFEAIQYNTSYTTAGTTPAYLPTIPDAGNSAEMKIYELSNEGAAKLRDYGDEKMPFTCSNSKSVFTEPDFSAGKVQFPLERDNYLLAEISLNTEEEHQICSCSGENRNQGNLSETNSLVDFSKSSFTVECCPSLALEESVSLSSAANNTFICTNHVAHECDNESLKNDFKFNDLPCTSSAEQNFARKQTLSEFERENEPVTQAHVIQLDIDDTLIPTSQLCEFDWIDKDVEELPLTWRNNLTVLDHQLTRLFELLYVMVVCEDVDKIFMPVEHVTVTSTGNTGDKKTTQISSSESRTVLDRNLDFPSGDHTVPKVEISSSQYESTTLAKNESKMNITVVHEATAVFPGSPNNENKERHNISHTDKAKKMDQKSVLALPQGWKAFTEDRDTPTSCPLTTYRRCLTNRKTPRGVTKENLSNLAVSVQSDNSIRRSTATVTLPEMEDSFVSPLSTSALTMTQSTDVISECASDSTDGLNWPAESATSPGLRDSFSVKNSIKFRQQNYVLSVVIVTNATMLHVKSSFPKFLPTLTSFLQEKQIDFDDLVCSARDLWSDEFPVEHFYDFWKCWTLAEILKQLRTNDEVTAVTVFSVGDDEPERKAAAYVKQEIPEFVKGLKMIKMISHPTIAEISLQIEHLIRHIRSYINSPTSFDLIYKFENLDSEDLQALLMAIEVNNKQSETIRTLTNKHSCSTPQGSAEQAEIKGEKEQVYVDKMLSLDNLDKFIIEIPQSEPPIQLVNILFR